MIQYEENVFNEMFSFMAQSDEEDGEDKVTLLDSKKNLNTYSLKILRRLPNFLIDFVIALTSERDSMKAEFESLSENTEQMGMEMSVIENQMVVLESEKLELKNRLDIMIDKLGKRKGESTSLQIKLEENQKTSETKIALALERNSNLERDLFQPKEELSNFLKWTKSSK